MQDFRKLEIYKKSVDFCVEVYRFSARLPESEKYGLISQMRRAACSTPLNISEGAGTTTRKEFAQFISYAYRSVNEVLACFELSEKLGLYQEQNILNELCNEGISLSRMIYAFFKKLGAGTSDSLL